jgi:hypothetical protein
LDDVLCADSLRGFINLSLDIVLGSRGLQSLEIFVTHINFLDLFVYFEGSVDEAEDVFGEVVRVLN